MHKWWRVQSRARSFFLLKTVLLTCLLSSVGNAFLESKALAELSQEPSNPSNESAPVAPAAETPPPATVSSPYSLPWQLRTIIPGNAARLDSALAFYNDKNGNSGGFAAASSITGSYKLTPDLAGLVRLGMVNNNPPVNAPGASSFINPLFGAIYSLRLSDEFRLGFFLGLTAPIGTGGGNSPDPAVQAANSAGILARSAMDNALFAVNYFTVIPGVDIAYISHGVTVQLEATLLQLTRVRGEQIDKDSSRTNFTSGLAVGYSISPLFSVLGELRYQRWLDNATVSAAASPAVENLSFAIGPRFTIKPGSVTVKPGIAYAQGLAGPMANGNYTYPTNNDKVVFIDFPIVF